jgi:hypothetical protein
VRIGFQNDVGDEYVQAQRFDLGSVACIATITGPQAPFAYLPTSIVRP